MDYCLKPTLRRSLFSSLGIDGKDYPGPAELENHLNCGVVSSVIYHCDGKIDIDFETGLTREQKKQLEKMLHAKIKGN